MKNFLWIPIAFVLLPAAAWPQALPDNPEPARPAITDWNRVGDLARGDQIKVARGGRLAFPCMYAGATRDYLFCDSPFAWRGARSFRVDRAEIEDVRMNQQRRNFKIVVGGVAAAGFALGVRFPTANEVQNGSPRVLDGFAGAGLGVGVGVVVAAFVSPFIPGRLVYRRPRVEPQSQDILPSTSALRALPAQ